jgi:hypothetical protein
MITKNSFLSKCNFFFEITLKQVGYFYLIYTYNLKDNFLVYMNYAHKYYPSFPRIYMSGGLTHTH